MKKCLIVVLALTALCFLGGCKKFDVHPTGRSSGDLDVSTSEVDDHLTPAPSVIASTSWTAAFAYLGGADNVDIIAPANLRHPPEYEITAGDVVKITNSDFFIYAGFERMMENLGEMTAFQETPSHQSEPSSHQGASAHQGAGPKTVKIRCDNSIATVTESAGKIAEALGTVKVSQERVARYVAAVEEGRRKVEEMGLLGAPVLCNKNQIYLAKEIGLDVKGIFGPGPVSPGQIEDAKKSEYVFIIDNVHNPVGEPLKEVSLESQYIIWRNFPETVGEDTLLQLIEENINKIL